MLNSLALPFAMVFPLKKAETPSDPSPDAFDAPAFLATLTSRPGIYQMKQVDGKVIYVGKAKNLKNRVASYFGRVQGVKVRVMVSQIHAIDVTVTHTENEALILESQLIKKLKPRYNVLLRDDKSYPYIFLSDQHEYPRLGLYRGRKRDNGRYFGPYPSAYAVRETLNILQKIFPIRQCEDSFFQHRDRPCLQYQIKRCTGPCVGLITPEEYALAVRHAVLFLQGKNTQVINELVEKMEQASNTLKFEQAALIRDQIVSLRRVQEQQYVHGEKGNVDIIAAAQGAQLGCIQVFFIRNGQNLGNKHYFLKLPKEMSTGELLATFLAQYYLNRQIPDNLLVSNTLPDQTWLVDALTSLAKHKVTITGQPRGARAQWLKMAVTNAEVALQSRLASQAGYHERLLQLQDILSLKQLPERMECFDISHTQGELAVASCVVFGVEGAIKSDYRRFNIEGITPGDDYAAMHQALTRRYTRLMAGESALPDILFIDGGKGQVREAIAVLEALQVHGVMIVGVAKGAGRKVGMEGLVLPGRSELLYPGPQSSALHIIAQIRDEAHRFAITGHRQRRDKKRKTSVLEDIPGLGPKRRQSLLKQFGGLQEVARAGVEALSQVKGISTPLAEKIYDVFHSG